MASAAAYKGRVNVMEGGDHTSLPCARRTKQGRTMRPTSIFSLAMGMLLCAFPAAAQDMMRDTSI